MVPHDSGRFKCSGVKVKASVFFISGSLTALVSMAVNLDV
jgi:hypothetical protein